MHEKVVHTWNIHTLEQQQTKIPIQQKNSVKIEQAY